MTIRAVSLALAVVAMAAGRGAAQDDPTTQSYAFFSPLPTLDATKKPARGVQRADTLGLRPNVEQLAYVFVYNPTADDETVNVVLLSGTKATDKAVVAGAEIARTAAPITVPAGQVAKVTLAGKTAPAAVVATPADKDKPAVVAVPAGVLVDDQSNLILRVEKSGKPAKGEDANTYKDYEKTPVIINSVTTGLDVKPSAADGRLTVVVTYKPAADVPVFSRLPAKVRLDLRPDLNPDLDPESLKQGTFEAELPIGEEASQVTLFAEGVKYKTATPTKARVTLSVDGYERAFVIDTNFNEPPQTSPYRFTNVRLSADRQVPGKPVLVTVEADDKATDGVTLSVDRTGEGKYDVIQKRAANRRKAIYVKVGGANDGVQLTPVVEDWTYLFETKSVAGRRTFKVEARPAIKEADKPDNAHRTVTTEATQVLLVDRTAPTDVKLVDLPAKAATVTGTEHTLKAAGADAESGIADAYFYLGDAPGADGKPVPGGKVVRGVKAADGTWASKDPVRLPEVRGDVKVGVLFVNGVGLATNAETTLYVKDPEKPAVEKEKEKRTTGSIKGTVVQATRLQPDLPVSLRDGVTGKELKKTTTNSSGEFTFKDVPPGEYLVTTVKRADQNAKGSKPVTVEAVEKPATVEISVKR